MNTKNVTVGLLWHSLSSDNLGVGALTIGQMSIITEAARRQGLSCKFFVVGTRGNSSYNIQGFDVGGTGEIALRAIKAGRFEAFKYLARCNVVFDIGEGDSFADIYGIKRLTLQVVSKIFCRLSGVTLILSPQTIGPFESVLGRLLGKVGLHSAKVVYTRDALSSNCVRSMGFAHKLREVIDVAFALPFERPVRVQDGKIRLGINVSGLMYHSASDFGFTLDYRSLIDLVCEHMLSIPNAEVFLIPHVICDSIEKEDDWRVSEKLLQKHPGLKLAPRFDSPVSAKSFISGLDFLTGARMHACIAAISSGVAVVPMAYSRKFNGLFSSLKYDHVLDCKKLSTQQGFDFIRRSLENIPRLQEDVRAGLVVAKLKTDEYTSQIEEFLCP